MGYNFVVLENFFGFFLGVVFFQYPFPISGLEFPVRKLAVLTLLKGI